MTTERNLPDPAGAAPAARPTGARWKLALIFAVCAAPVIASYTMYYVIRPQGRTNYGDIIEPQRPMASVQTVELGGSPLPLSGLAGRWVMVSVDGGACTGACPEKLFAIRQVRLTTGKDRDRIERLMLVTDDATPSEKLRAEHEGMVIARIGAADAARLFPADAGRNVSDHVYVIDPLGNLMMRFPAGADPSRMKKDIARLLRASRTG